MCSRFELNSPARDVTARFGLVMALPNLPGPEVRPTDPALVITAGGPRILRFGLAVTWGKRPLINGRVESLGERNAFQPLLGNRCLVPATAWIEWQDIGPGRKKPMWRLRPAQSPLGIFTLAGLVGEEAFVILTCAAKPAIADIHDRMPVVLSGTWERAWLDPTCSFADLQPALAPYTGDIEAKPAAAQLDSPAAQPSLFD